MHGHALGIEKSMRHSFGLREEDQPISGAGGAMAISMRAMRNLVDEEAAGGEEEGRGGDLQKSRTHGEVLTKSAWPSEMMILASDI